MGQRHQIYAAYPRLISRYDLEAGEAAKNVQRKGLYHQWLFGLTAVGCLLQTLKLQENAHTFTNYADNIHPILWSLFNVNVETGYSNMPRQGEDISNNYISESDGLFVYDNNDGYTIMVFCTPDGKYLAKPKYCYWFPLENDFPAEVAPRHTPLSAEQYIELYYPNRQHPAHMNAKPEHNAELKKDIDRLIKRMKRYEVLTKDEVLAYFPRIISEDVHEAA